MRHHPAGNTAGRALGVTELANDSRDHGPLHCHGLLAVTSHARDPSSRPSGVT